MAEEKRYYWLRLYDDFFGSFRIKKLRKMAGGNTYVIIYLKMQLKAMKTDGILQYRGLGTDFVDELAIDIDEEPDDVRVTLLYLLSCGLAETNDQKTFFFPYSVKNTGSEGASAQRMRDARAKTKELEVNNVRTLCEHRYGEIEKEKDTKDIEKDRKGRFTPPTLEEVKAYCRERNNGVDAERFLDYYTANGWKVGKNPMKDWRAAVRTWERDSFPKQKKTTMPGIPKETGEDDSDRLLSSLGVGNG